MVLGEVKMAFDVQQGLLEEGQPLDFMLLALVKHLLHALHVLRSALVQLIQRLLILFFRLRKNRENTVLPEAVWKINHSVIISVSVASLF